MNIELNIRYHSPAIKTMLPFNNHGSRFSAGRASNDLNGSIINMIKYIATVKIVIATVVIGDVLFP